MRTGVYTICRRFGMIESGKKRENRKETQNKTHQIRDAKSEGTDGQTRAELTTTQPQGYMHSTVRNVVHCGGHGHRVKVQIVGRYSCLFWSREVEEEEGQANQKNCERATHRESAFRLWFLLYPSFNFLIIIIMCRSTNHESESQDSNQIFHFTKNAQIKTLVC